MDKFLFFSAFLMEKYPESKRGRKEMSARKKAEKRLAKDQGLPPPAKKPKTYAKTPLEVIGRSDIGILVRFDFPRFVARVHRNLTRKSTFIKFGW